MSRSWAPRLLFMLAAVAQVGALMPLFLLSRRLMPVQLASLTFSLDLPGVGPSPLVLLLAWLGGWWIASRAPHRTSVLTPLLLAASLLLAWLGLPFAGRSTSPLNLIFVLSLLPPLVVAWWGGSRFGTVGLTWASTYDNLRLSIAACLFGLLSLQPFPPVGREVALLGPILLFTAGMPLLYLVRPREEALSWRTTIIAVTPVFVVAFVFWLFRSATAAPLLLAIGRLGGAVLEAVMALFAPVAGAVATFLIDQQKPQGLGEPPKEKGDWGDVPYTDGSLANLRSDPGPLVVGVVVILGLLLLAYLIWRSRAKRGRSATLELDEERTGPGLLGGLLAELRHLLSRAPEPPVDSLPADHPRQLLRRLQQWGARAGRSRRQAETPRQYEAALRPLLPTRAGQEGLSVLIQAYGEARYGSGRPDSAQLQSAQALLADLERPGD